LNKWKNYFCQLLNVHGAGDVRQNEVHAAEPFVPEPSASEAEFAIGMVKRYKSPGVDQIPAELIQAGGETSRSVIHKLIKLICNKEYLPEQSKNQLWYLFTERVTKPTVVFIKAYHCCQLHTEFYPTLTPYADEITEDNQREFRRNRSTTDQIFYIRQIQENNGSVIVQYVSYL
jgi:hypothetical protein